VGQFEEEEEGTGIASDVKVKGENLATPRLSEGRQGEEVRRRFSIVGACSLGSLYL